MEPVLILFVPSSVFPIVPLEWQFDEHSISAGQSSPSLQPNIFQISVGDLPDFAFLLKKD